eukprot:TRINITY_DN8888_c0_g1_i14.p1 TRINITY_DN8888_c0_g1~~TRINITY_DN8888_c0_g1_i14.p1  ORF type:complete len:108 (+),score=28.38 TRINITY_DN8888_c0_g1_i14:187-510(+)
MCIRDRVSTQSTGDRCGMSHGESPQLEALIKHARQLGDKMLHGDGLPIQGGKVTREQINAVGDAILSGKMDPALKRRVQEVGAAMMAQRNTSQVTKLGEELLRRAQK